MKFYMNNPCKIVREIGEEFSEVQVWPKFADSMQGSNWCTACMAGAGYSPHTCEPYQDVIDVINDTSASIVVVVENRLLHDKPVEFAKYEKAKEMLVETQAKTEDLNKELLEKKLELARVSDHLVSINEEIVDKKQEVEVIQAFISTEEDKLDSLRKSVKNQNDRININGISLSMTSGELRDLIKASIELEKLEACGVDNWEWYGESLDCDIDALADNYIKGLTVCGIG